MTLEYISIGIAFISVVAAIYFGFKSQRLEKKNTDLQKRLLEIEETRDRERKRIALKANLTARIENYGQSSYRLVVENTGNGEARNIVLKMDGKPFNDHGAAVTGDGDINRIGARSFATRLLGLTMACAPPFELEVSWDDDSCEVGHYQTTLTF